MLALVDPHVLEQALSDPLGDDVRAAARGDAVALRRLCVELAPVVLRTLRRLLGGAHPDLEDLLQDTLIAVLDGLRGFRGESSVKHYARRIATLRALETIRNVRSRARKLEAAAEEELAPRASHENPGKVLLDKRRQELLHELLCSLPPAHAETLVLQAVLGHSLAETAEILGVPVNTVRGRLQTAKHDLRARILDHPELLELSELEDDHPR